MGRCIICNKEIGAKDIYLLNGEAIHRECVDMLKSEETELDANINMCFEKKIQLESKISKYSSFFYRLRSFFNSDYKSRLKDLEIQNLENNNKLFELKIERNKILENKRNTLFDIYSNWPERPPDWEYRRRVLLNKQDYCMECGEIKGSLHVYHKRPISEGGNHSEENLVVICASCYSKMHGDRDLFIGTDRRRETAFTKKYRILRQAAATNRSVHFNYRKYEGERSERTIYPESFKKIGTSLCVSGYCTLRNEDRTFAIKRITKLQMLD